MLFVKIHLVFLSGLQLDEYMGRMTGLCPLCGHVALLTTRDRKSTAPMNEAIRLFDLFKFVIECVIL